MDCLPDDQCERIFAGESPLKVWREWRGLSLVELAYRADVHRYTIERAEVGTKKLKESELWRLAAALNVLVMDLRPHRSAYNSCCRELSSKS